MRNLSLTKDKLIALIQTQVGLGKQEARQLVERLLEIKRGKKKAGVWLTLP
jgi:hypothetical protein